MYNNTFPSSCSTSAPTVPFDMCLEILTRVSHRTLAVCKQVCKDWFKLVHESYFTNFYHQRSGVVSGYYIQSIERCHVHSTFVTMHTPLLPKGSSACLNLQFLPIRDPTILASSRQGLLCCVSQEKIPRYYVCKPATKEWRQIPNPKTKYFTDNIAMLVVRSNPAHFMIVRFSEPKYRWYVKIYRTLFAFVLFLFTQIHRITVLNMYFLVSAASLSKENFRIF